MNHQPGIVFGMNVQSDIGIGIGIVVSGDSQLMISTGSVNHSKHPAVNWDMTEQLITALKQKIFIFATLGSILDSQLS